MNNIVFLHKINVHVKSILNLRVRIQANAWNDTPTGILTKAQLLPCWPTTSEKLKLINIFFGGDVAICMYLPPPLPMSHFVTNFVNPQSPLPWWRHFWMAP